MSSIPTEIVQRFAAKRKTTLTEANNLFEQLEHFLDTASVCASSPSADVDDAWHEFVLHTRQYSKYCLGRYGRFIHHVPTSPVSCDGECSTGVSEYADGNQHAGLPLAKCDSDGDDRCSSDCVSGGNDD